MVFLRKYWVFIILAAVAVFFGFLWAQGRFSLLGPVDETEQVDKKKTQPVNSNLPKVLFPTMKGGRLPQGVPITIQKQPPVESVSLYAVDQESLGANQAKAIAKTFSFNTLPYISEDVSLGTYYGWGEGGKSLSIRLSPAEILFTSSGLTTTGPSPTSNLLKDSDVARSIEKLLVELGLNPRGIDLSLVSSRKLPDKNVVEVGFSSFIESGTFVVDQYPTTPLVIAQVQGEDNLLHLSYRVGFSSPQKTVSYPAKGVEDLQSSLSTEGKIMLLGELSEIQQPLTPSSITITEIKNALLFFAEESATLYPIFILEGSANTEIGDIPIVLYIPAVQSDYLLRTTEN
ncbi:MAG: hypothetical protein Q7S60_03550 [bacterium]|nr:hypothetical protein [bacterium]